MLDEIILTFSERDNCKRNTEICGNKPLNLFERNEDNVIILDS